MPLGRDRWVEVTPSRYPHERAGLEYIRNALPNEEPYRAWSGLEIITDRGRSFDIDLLVIGPGGIFLVELKAWRGRITGDRYAWALHGDRRTHTKSNPWRLTNEKARVLRSILGDTLVRETPHSRPDPTTAIPFVQAAVFLHNPEVHSDLRPDDRPFVFGLDEETARTGLPGIVSGLLTPAPHNPERLVTGTRSRVLKVLLDRSGMGRRPPRPIGAYLLGELVDEGPGWQDFVGVHGRYDDERVRIRIYYTGRATTSEERAALDRAAEREYRLLRHLDHPGLVTPLQQMETDLGPALIYPLDETAARLDHLLATRAEPLPLETQLAIIRGIAETLRYAHGRHIIHRGLAPRSVIVRLDGQGQPLVRIADWQTAARAATTSGTALPGSVMEGTEHVQALLDPSTYIYQAPEAGARVDVDETRLDVFSLGALAYLVLTGQPPGEDLPGLRRRLAAEGGLDLAGHLDGVPEGLRALVLDATRGEVAMRLPDVEAFLDRLAQVERELAEPEPPEDLDPLEAPPGTRLGDRWRLVRRLGGGATAIALLVEDTEDRREPPGQAVLKVARDEERARRLDDELEVLRGLDDPRVARLVEQQPLRLAGRKALVLEYAGDETLARVLREQGRLSLDRLERYGDDLLGIAAYLDAAGVDHRDIKPDNLGIRTRPGDRQKHLVLFDFSLSRTPASEITAGTPPYLDPFLGQRTRRRWDGAAERYAVAVTLFEMATGHPPKYGDGQSDPAVLEGVEATVEPGMFDPAVGEPLTEFFARALRRDARERFDTVEQMHRAWREVFRQVGAAATTGEGDAERRAAAADLRTPLVHAGLTARALSALEPLGVATVAELLDIPAARLSRLAGVNEPTRRELRIRTRQWRHRLRPSATPPGAATPSEPRPALQSIDAIVRHLVPRGRNQEETRVRAARLLLGLPADAEGRGPLPPPWPAQGDLARLLDVTRARAQQLDAELKQRWLRSATPLVGLRNDLVAFVDASGGVVGLGEAAEALLVMRGSIAEEPQRTRQALGLVRAVVESEQQRFGDARLTRRRRVDGTVLIATELPSGETGPTGTQRIDYAAALGRVAGRLVASDHLPVPAARAVERLEEVPRPEGMAPLDEARLVRLATEASATAAVSNKGELYRRGLPAGVALRTSGAAMVAPGASLSVDALRERVRARFPDAEPLPDRPALDALLEEVPSPLRWDGQTGAYRAPEERSGTHLTSRSPTRIVTASSSEGLPVDDVDRWLRESLELHGFLAVGVDPRRLGLAGNVLATHYGIARVDVTAVLIARMRELAASAGIPWEEVLAADADDPGSYRGQGLRRMVEAAVASVEEAVKVAGGPVLLTEVAPLARYGQLGLLDRETDHTTVRPAALWVLLPAGELTEVPMVDDQPLTILSPAQWLKIPNDWLQQRSSPAPGGPP
jgi:serine/threonine protein kinase